MSLNKKLPDVISKIIKTTEELRESWGYFRGYDDNQPQQFMYTGEGFDPFCVLSGERNLIDITNSLGNYLGEAKECFNENNPISFNHWLIIKDAISIYDESYNAIISILSKFSEQLNDESVHIFRAVINDDINKNHLLTLDALSASNINDEFKGLCTSLSKKVEEANQILCELANLRSEIYEYKSEEEEIELFYQYFREYVKINRKERERQLKKVAEKHKENHSSRLNPEHWGKLIEVENNYYQQALHGSLQKDGKIIDSFTDLEIWVMNSDSKMMNLLSDNFGDEELFDFERAFRRGLLKNLRNVNLDTLCNLILRGSIIRYRVFEELEEEFNLFLTPPELRKYKDTPLNPNNILSANNEEKQNKAKVLIIQAYEAKLQNVEDNMLLCLFVVMKNHGLTDKVLSNYKDFATALVKWQLYTLKEGENEEDTIKRLYSSLANKVSELRDLFGIKGRGELPLYKTWETKIPYEYNLCTAIASYFERDFPYKRLN